jgi:hypothetical protein
MKTTSKSQIYYKPPLYHGLYTNLLSNSKVNVSKLVIVKMWISIHKYGTIIYFDGWDNVAKHPLLNVMFACFNGDAFLSGINTMREHKDAPYICNGLVGCIKIVEVDNIVQKMFQACEM